MCVGQTILKRSRFRNLAFPDMHPVGTFGPPKELLILGSSTMAYIISTSIHPIAWDLRLRLPGGVHDTRPKVLGSYDSLGQ